VLFVRAESGVDDDGFPCVLRECVVLGPVVNHADPQTAVHSCWKAKPRTSICSSTTSTASLPDTRDLFALDRRVAADDLKKAAARATLMSAERRFTLDAD